MDLTVGTGADAKTVKLVGVTSTKDLADQINTNASKLGLKANIDKDGALTVESASGENVSFGQKTGSASISVRVQDAAGTYSDSRSVGSGNGGQTVVGYMQLNSSSSYAVTSTPVTNKSMKFNDLALTVTPTSGTGGSMSFNKITVSGQDIDLTGVSFTSTSDLLTKLAGNSDAKALLDFNSTGIRAKDGGDITFGTLSQTGTGGKVEYTQLKADGSSTTAADVGTTAISAQSVTLNKPVEGSNQIFGTGKSNLGSVAQIDISTADGAQRALSVLDNALAGIDSQRADLGAVQNRFDNTINNLQNISENASAAKSRIKDTDYAAETANLSKNQVLQQAGTAILAQAKQLPQAVLSLLQ